MQVKVQIEHDSLTHLRSRAIFIEGRKQKCIIHFFFEKNNI